MIVGVRPLPIRHNEEEIMKDMKAVDDILVKGTALARAVAQETIERVRNAMKIDYFSVH